MRQFTVLIKEVHLRQHTVWAESEEAAKDKAESLVDSGSQAETFDFLDTLDKSEWIVKKIGE